MNVEVFIPDSIDKFFPDTGFNLIKLLEKLEISVSYNSEAACCGRDAYQGGYWDVARELGENFINSYSGEKPIIIPSANCLDMVKKQFAILFNNSSLHNKAIKIADNSFDTFYFINKKLKISDFNAEFPHKVLVVNPSATYYYPENIKTLLSNVKSLELVEGSFKTEFSADNLAFNLVHENISSAMIKRLVDEAVEKGAEYIAMQESSALLHIQAYINKNSVNLKVINLIDILASNW